LNSLLRAGFGPPLSNLVSDFSFRFQILLSGLVSDCEGRFFLAFGFGVGVSVVTSRRQRGMWVGDDTRMTLSMCAFASIAGIGVQNPLYES